MSLQVKVLYVRNLMLSTTEARIEEAFSAHAPVERVKKIKDYAFVHFGTRQHAHLAMQAMNGNGNSIFPVSGVTVNLGGSFGSILTKFEGVPVVLYPITLFVA